MHRKRLLTGKLFSKIILNVQSYLFLWLVLYTCIESKIQDLYVWCMSDIATLLTTKVHNFDG